MATRANARSINYRHSLAIWISRHEIDLSSHDDIYNHFTPT